MKKNFVKMHGLGNDFAIFDGRAEPLGFSPLQIRALADRRRGIGFDQMVVLEPPTAPTADVFMRIYNADGGEVEACGNATRCVARLLGRESMTIETRPGLLKVACLGEKVSVDMGVPYITQGLALTAGPLQNPVGVDIGNPHAVFFVEDAESVDLAGLGPKVERHPLFPDRTNVEVAQVLSPDKIRLRVWERGTGITQACGTGACATAAAAHRLGLTNRRVAIVLDGGTLDIEWRESDGHILMTGAVAEVYRAEIEL